MSEEEAIKILKEINVVDFYNTYTDSTTDFSEPRKYCDAIETILDLYNKEKENNKNAIDFINKRKTTVDKDMAEGTRLQVGTFMWQVDELLEILKGVKEE